METLIDGLIDGLQTKIEIFHHDIDCVHGVGSLTQCVGVELLGLLTMSGGRQKQQHEIVHNKNGWVYIISDIVRIF